jgi:hypothetical protein
MISELMVKHRVSGTVSDWKPGVEEEEFDIVSDIRFEEVEETREESLEKG